MTSVSDNHDETVKLISDAVTEVTKRAIDPTLEPFKKSMTNAVRGLDQKAAALDALIRPSQRDREATTQMLSEIAATQEKLAAYQRDLLERLGHLQTWVQNQNAQCTRISADLRVIRWLIVLATLATITAVPAILLLATR
jgi:hypothetical protein